MQIDTAKRLLESGYTCVLIKDEQQITCTDTGIKPMIKLIDSGTNLEGFVVADKIVGKAVANLFVLAKISEVYATVISKNALSFLNEHKIKVSYNTLTDNIINRAGTGLCPMEQTVLNETDPKKAYILLKAKLKELQTKNN